MTSSKVSNIYLQSHHAYRWHHLLPDSLECLLPSRAPATIRSPKPKRQWQYTGKTSAMKEITWLTKNLMAWTPEIRSTSAQSLKACSVFPRSNQQVNQPPWFMKNMVSMASDSPASLWESGRASESIGKWWVPREKLPAKTSSAANVMA